MRIYPFTAMVPQQELVTDPDLFFTTTRAQFPRYHEQRVFVHDDASRYYVYRISKGQATTSGLVAALDVREIINGYLKPHELTIPAKEAKLTDLLLARRAMIKPVLAGVSNDLFWTQYLERALDTPPMVKLVLGDETSHEVFRLPLDKSAELQRVFHDRIHSAYIADGHHRCSSITGLLANQQPADLMRFDRILTFFVPFDQLVIYDFNRLVNLPPSLSFDPLLKQLSELCDVQPIASFQKPTGKFQIVLYGLGRWYQLRWKSEVLAKYEHREVIFDSLILDEEVLRPMVGMRDATTDPGVKYVEGKTPVEDVIEKVERIPGRIAFFLYPVPLEDVITASDLGQTLPPKSTWFEPRMLNGMISMRI